MHRLAKIKFFFTLCLLVLCENIFAQYKLSGIVVNKQNNPLEGVAIIVLDNDSLVGGGATDVKGKFSMQGFPSGTYLLNISILGYKSVELPIQISENIVLQSIQMEEDSKVLNEVVISADQRNLLSIGAGTSSFHLSKQASQTKNAFEALQEIPRLVVDVTGRKISMQDGTEPLILIDGVNRVGYISSLDPADIESVEVINNPSARYRGNQSVASLLNIKLKQKKAQPYLNGNFYTRHNPQLIFGVSGASFEVGNSKSALYLNAQQFYFHNENRKTNSLNRSGSMVRSLLGKDRYSSNMVYLNLGGDLIASSKNYWAFGITFITNPSKNKINSEGSIAHSSQIEPTSSLSVEQQLNNDYYTSTYNLYYKHTFSDKSHLEATGLFGLFGSGSSGNRLEKSDFYIYNYKIDMDNTKKSFNLELNYDFSIVDKFALNVGANTYMQRSSLNDITDKFPAFIYKDLTEYIYGEIHSIHKKPFSYMLSLGLDLVFTNADAVKNQYVNFVPSASLAYQFNKQNNLQLNLLRSRTSPSISDLNPRNTSTDSLKLYIGNPYLKPSLNNQVDLRYIWNRKGIYLEPFISYNYYTDIIQSMGYLSENIYILTPENVKNAQCLRTGITARINLSNFGNANLTTYYRKDYIKGAPFDGEGWGINGFLYLYYKRVSLRMNIRYNGVSYWQIGKSISTPESEATFTWSLPKNWSLTAGVRYFAASSNNSRSWIQDKEYESYNKIIYSDRYLMPLVGFSYYFQNKVTNKWRQKKQIYNSDEGMQGIQVK